MIKYKILSLLFVMPFLVLQANYMSQRFSQMVWKDLLKSAITLIFLTLITLLLISKSAKLQIQFKNIKKLMVLAGCSILLFLILNLLQDKNKFQQLQAACLLVGMLVALLNPQYRSSLSLLIFWVILTFSQQNKYERFIIYFYTVRIVQIINQEWSSRSIALSSAIVVCLNNKISIQILLIFYMALENQALLYRFKYLNNLLVIGLPAFFCLQFNFKQNLIVPASVALFIYDQYLSNSISKILLKYSKIDVSYLLISFAVIFSFMKLQLQLHEGYLSLALLRMKLLHRKASQEQESKDNVVIFEEFLFLFYFSLRIEEIKQVDISIVIMSFLFGISFISFYTYQVLKAKVKTLRLIVALALPLLISVALKFSQIKQKFTDYKKIIEIALFYFLIGCSLGTILFVKANKKGLIQNKIMGGYKVAAIITRALIK